MNTQVEPLLPWLQRERRTNVIQEILWIQHFDVDGAVVAGQPELAWRARAAIIVFAAELRLRRWGVYPPSSGDHTATAPSVLRHLEVLDPDLARDTWDLLLRGAPETETELASEIADTRRFLGERLGVPEGVSKVEAIRSWANGLRRLRAASKGLGIGESDGWYLLQRVGREQQTDWYEEVMSIVAAEDDR
ncbi:hypothetical protein [Catellatospora tritici]|uniref:hypothetical protein n=1 Tax=Catellatospora tritici TaxID=2851566 RepID=UPI001C2D19F2|nr:hypothetical protein [Catellatospora tritici]MBV1849569.1 hypothetical protein [Catellatospora tritici]